MDQATASIILAIVGPGGVLLALRDALKKRHAQNVERKRWDDEALDSFKSAVDRLERAANLHATHIHALSDAVVHLRTDVITMQKILPRTCDLLEKVNAHFIKRKQEHEAQAEDSAPQVDLLQGKKKGTAK